MSLMLFKVFPMFLFEIELIISTTNPLVSPSPGKSQTVPKFVKQETGENVVDPEPSPTRVKI